MKITVLSENTTSNASLSSEHGLSIYIETENHKILFDMGQSDIFYKNATGLGIDLSKVDFAFLSHGHYDHGGGLEKFLNINETAKVYLSPKAFERYYSQNGYIGLDSALKENPRLVFCNEVTKKENFTIFPGSLLPTPFGINPYGLEKENHVPDNFEHEQYLLMEENGKKILVSGCSHKGILNIVNYFEPDILIGGFHFMKIEPFGEGLNVLSDMAEKLNSYDTTYYTCHCTGCEQYEKLKSKMKEKLHYINTGSIVEI